MQLLSLPHYMKKIIIDCNRKSAADIGLLFFCLNLSEALHDTVGAQANEQIKCFVKKSEAHRFKLSKKSLVVEKWYHRFFNPIIWSCDVWHASSNSGSSIPFLLPKTKVVLTLHEWPNVNDGKEYETYLNHIKKLIAKCSTVVCVSEHILRQAKPYIKQYNKPFTVINVGSNFLPDAPPYPTKYKPYLPFVFSIGDIEVHKKFHSLLPMLRDQHIELVIAGRIVDKAYADEIRKLAWNANVSDRVRFIGAINDADKAWYFRNCKAFAFPSKAAGSGAALLEAFRFMNPIFLNDDSPLAEFGGDACFYMDGDDAENVFEVYNECLQNFSKHHYNQRLMHRARLFQWSEKAAEYLQLYRSLLY